MRHAASAPCECTDHHVDRLVSHLESCPPVIAPAERGGHSCAWSTKAVHTCWPPSSSVCTQWAWHMRCLAESKNGAQPARTPGKSRAHTREGGRPDSANMTPALLREWAARRSSTATKPRAVSTCRPSPSQGQQTCPPSGRHLPRCPGPHNLQCGGPSFLKLAHAGWQARITKRRQDICQHVHRPATSHSSVPPSAPSLSGLQARTTTRLAQDGIRRGRHVMWHSQAHGRWRAAPGLQCGARIHPRHHQTHAWVHHQRSTQALRWQSG